MANLVTRRLVRAIRSAPSTFNAPLAPPLPMFGTITAVQSTAFGDTVTLMVGAGGGTVTGVEILGSYSPVVGDSVYYHMIHSVPIVQGKTA